MNLAVVCVTARKESLKPIEDSLALQIRNPDATFLVSQEAPLPNGWQRANFVEPYWYAPEMAINAGMDAAFKSGADIAVYVGDMSWFGSTYLYQIEEYLRERLEVPLLSGVNCLHEDANSLCEAATTYPDLGLSLRYCNFSGAHQEGEAVKQNLEQFHREGVVHGPIPAIVHLVSHTAVRRAAWGRVNGLDERFTGASGYIDSNLALRIEAGIGPCHLHTGVVTHRINYRALKTNRIQVPKPKLYPNSRNETLFSEILEKEIKQGLYRAVRFDETDYSKPSRAFPPERWSSR